MFVDREIELESLNKQWSSPGSSFVVIYGRRRIGKTSLVKEFIKKKEHVYFLATEMPIQDQLKGLQRQAGAELGIELLKNQPFRRWEDLFDYISGLDRRFILVIDEFPYLIKAEKAIPSLFQKGWDEHLKDSKIDLILCGSSISMIEESIMKSDSPLYGRKTSQIKLKELPVGSLKKFLPNTTFEDIIRFYAVYGGVPAYLELLDPKKGLHENIKATVLKLDAPLKTSVDFILRSELRKPERYRAILSNITRGSTTLNQLSNDLETQGNRVSQYLSKLRTLGLVSREEPVTLSPLKKRRRGIYTVTDNFFRFYFRFILPNLSAVEEGKTKVVSDEFDTDETEFVSPVFEDICQNYLLNNFDHSKTGRWWYGEDEIDILALNEKEDRILFGECKWSKKKVGKQLLFDLKEKSKKVRWKNEVRKEEFALFSRSGFSRGLKQISEDSDDIRLYSLDDMEKVMIGDR